MEASTYSQIALFIGALVHEVTTVFFAILQGYFQLKANPGAWILRLRKGRSEDIYNIYR